VTTRHRQVPVPYGGTTVEVDEGLAELLAVVWAHGATTTASCESDPDGLASVTFASADDAVILLNLATDEDTPELPGWTYEAEAVNRAADDGGPSDHTFRHMTVRFPPEHIPVALGYARAKPSHASR
jgi:hypothetical protein